MPPSALKQRTVAAVLPPQFDTASRRYPHRIRDISSRTNGRTRRSLLSMPDFSAPLGSVFNRPPPPPRTCRRLSCASNPVYSSPSSRLMTYMIHRGGNSVKLRIGENGSDSSEGSPFSPPRQIGTYRINGKWRMENGKWKVPVFTGLPIILHSPFSIPQANPFFPRG